MEAPKGRPPPPPSEPAVPVVISHSKHVRKPSDGAKQDLTPITEDASPQNKNTQNKKNEKPDLESSSDADTIKASAVKVSNPFTPTDRFTLIQNNEWKNPL